MKTTNQTTTITILRLRTWTCNTSGDWREFETITDAEKWISGQYDEAEKWARENVADVCDYDEAEQMSEDEQIADWLASGDDSTWFCYDVETRDEDGDWQQSGWSRDPSDLNDLAESTKAKP